NGCNTNSVNLGLWPSGSGKPYHGRLERSQRIVLANRLADAVLNGFVDSGLLSGWAREPFRLPRASRPVPSRWHRRCCWHKQQELPLQLIPEFATACIRVDEVFRNLVRSSLAGCASI